MILLTEKQMAGWISWLCCLRAVQFFAIRLGQICWPVSSLWTCCGLGLKLAWKWKPADYLL